MFEVEHAHDGFRLTNETLSVTVARIDDNGRNRWATIGFFDQASGAALIPQRRMDLLDERAQNRLLGTLTAADQATDWDSTLAQVVEVAQTVQHVEAEGGSSPADLTSAVVSLEDLLAMEIPPRKTIMGWLQERTLAMIYGARGVGKTHFALSLAVSLTSGRDFLGWQTPAPVGVLVIDGEMPLDDLRQRVVNLSGDAAPTNLFILSSEIVFTKFEQDLVLTQERWREAVMRILDEHPEIGVVLIDNISTLFAGLREDSKDEWEPVNAWLINLRHRKLAVVLIHHAGKGGGQRGTSAREDVLDVVIRLDLPPDHEPEAGCKFDLKFTKNRSVKGEVVKPLRVKLEEAKDGTLFWDWQPLVASYEQQVASLLEEGLSGKEIAEELGLSKSYVSKLKRRIETPSSG